MQGITSGRLLALMKNFVSSLTNAINVASDKIKIYVENVDVITLYKNKLLTRGNLYPVTDNADTLGIAAKTWANVYTKELTLNGSALSSTLSTLAGAIGTLASLTTTNKADLVSAINELAARVTALETDND